MEFDAILLGSAITGLFASIGTYVGYKFLMRNLRKELQKGLLTDIVHDLLVDISEDPDLQTGLKNVARIMMNEVLKGLQIGGTQKKGSIFEQIIGGIAQKALGGGGQGETQVKLPWER